MDLSYLNARVRGIKGRLLDRADYELLFSSVKDLGGLVEVLRLTSAYGPYIASAGALYEREEDALDAALRNNFSDHLRMLWNLLPEAGRPYLKAVLSAYDAHNLKTVLRGLDRGVKRDEIFLRLVPAPETDAASLKRLVAAKDVSDFVRLLATWGSAYAAPVRRALPAYARTKSLADMETALDKFAIEHWAAVLSKRGPDGMVVTEILSTRADAANAAVLLKAAGEKGFEARPLFISHGALLGEKAFLRLSRIGERDALIEALGNEIKERRLRGVVMGLDADDLGLFEERVDDLIARRLLALSITMPESIALASWSVYARAREVKNLRLLALAKRSGAPAEEFWGMLFYPRLARAS